MMGLTWRRRWVLFMQPWPRNRQSCSSKLGQPSRKGKGPHLEASAKTGAKPSAAAPDCWLSSASGNCSCVVSEAIVTLANFEILWNSSSGWIKIGKAIESKPSLIISKRYPRLRRLRTHSVHVSLKINSAIRSACRGQLNSRFTRSQMLAPRRCNSTRSIPAARSSARRRFVT
ncbi:MAG: hypothetical protein JWQ04_1521 [Pedosphaera sp.]|nr:hypothetical protein [Pedosphaera sp.]